MSDYQNRINEIVRQRRELRDQQEELREEWVKSECPHQPGDVATITAAHSLTGKAILVEVCYVVNRPAFPYSWAWHICGRLVRDDGTVGDFETGFYLPIDSVADVATTSTQS
jgi:hypothetical protein